MVNSYIMTAEFQIILMDLQCYLSKATKLIQNHHVQIFKKKNSSFFGKLVEVSNQNLCNVQIYKLLTNMNLTSVSVSGKLRQQQDTPTLLHDTPISLHDTGTDFRH